MIALARYITWARSRIGRFFQAGSALFAAATAAATSSSAGQLAAGQLPDEQPQEAWQGIIAPVGYGDVIMRHEVTLARWSAIDDRIETLVADMHMFTGELKVVAMDALLTAIVERQSAMRAEMRLMHGGQMPQLRGRSVPDAPLAWSDEEPGSWLDEEPARMCAPEEF